MYPVLLCAFYFGPKFLNDPSGTQLLLHSSFILVIVLCDSALNAHYEDIILGLNFFSFSPL